MIKAVVNGKDGPTLFLMFTQENIDRLQQKLPVLINMADLGLPEGRVVIGYGTDHDDAVDQLRQAGLPIADDVPAPGPGEVISMDFQARKRG